jgi:hypothetical protein
MSAFAGRTALVQLPVQITKRLVQITGQVRPGPIRRAMPRNDYIIGSGPRPHCQFGAGKRTQAAARPVAAHGIPGFF